MRSNHKIYPAFRVKSAFVFHAILWLSLSFPLRSHAQSGTANRIDDRLYFFDNTSGTYMPLVQSVEKNVSNILLPVSRYEFPGARIKFRLPENSHMFLNGKYFYSAPVETTKWIDFDSLFSANPGDSLFIGIYLPGKNVSKLQVSVSPKGGKIPEEGNDGAAFLRPFHSGVRNFLIIGFLLIAAYIAFLLNFDRKLFGQYLNIGRILMRPETDDLLDRNKPVGGTDLLFVILEALLLGFFLYIILFGIGTGNDIEHHEFFRGMFYWTIISIAVLIWILLKFNLVRNLSYLLQIRDVGKVHFIESSRITLFMLMAYWSLSLVLLFIFKVNFNRYALFLAGSLVYIAFLRMILIMLKILIYAPYKKMYIISYLCASELIPVVLGLKLILDSSLATWFI